MIRPYVVQSGDGFAAIARKMGSVKPYVDMEYIARANGLSLNSVIQPGRILWYDDGAITVATAPPIKLRKTVDGGTRTTTDGTVRSVV